MNEIINYYIEEKQATPVVAKVLAKKLMKYPDIENEFLYWLRNRDFNAPDAIEIGGYTAQKISEIAPSLDAAGVYSFMVTLREDPEKAGNYISKGFPTK